MLALVSLDVIRKSSISGDEHRLFLLAQIEYERIILRSLAKAAFDCGAGSGWQIRFQRIAQVFVEDERLLFLAHHWHPTNSLSVLIQPSHGRSMHLLYVDCAQFSGLLFVNALSTLELS